MTKYYIGILFYICCYNCLCQQEQDTCTIESDSTYFRQVKKQLIGCWRTKHYQFKYRDNFGSEYKSRVHSSAPVFKLVLKNGEVYIKWLELLGGENLQKVISIKKRRLIVENEDNARVVYKRNKNCSSLVRGIK